MWPSRSALLRRPASPELAPHLTARVGAQGAYQLTVLFTLLFAGPALLDLKYSSRSTCVEYDASDDCVRSDYTHATIVFNTFVFMQLFNQLNCRHLATPLNPLKGISRAPTFVAIVGAEMLLQVLLVQLAGEFFDTTGLSAGHWAVCLALSAATIPLALVQRFIPPVAEDPAHFAGANVQAQYRTRQLSTQISTFFEALPTRLARPSSGPAFQEVQMIEAPHHSQPLEPLLRGGPTSNARDFA